MVAQRLTNANPHRSPPRNPYIPHLDGLRAVALLAVLLFHFRVELFRSGYLGVDIFLTLSGFLITSTILHRLEPSNSETCTFSLPQFFKRRFFRLYPASTLIVLLSVLFSYLAFPNNLAERVSYSALASQFLSANIYFNARDNYFDKDAVVKPLLHMWSLSLEEQFYILWAPFIALLWKIPSTNTRSAFVTLWAIASILIAIGLQRKFPSFVFFQLPPRLFQFTAGALLALYLATRPRDEELQNDRKLPSSPPTWSSFLLFNAIAFLCVLTYAFSCTQLTEAPPPYLLLLLTAATVLIISLPECSFTTRLFSTPSIRYIGRISYSAYLIHWPLFVYARYLTQPFPYLRLFVMSPLTLSFVTLVIAACMHRFVEVPFRQRSSSSLYIVVLLVLIVVTLSVSAIGVISFGFSFRLSARRKQVLFDRHWKPECEPWVQVVRSDIELTRAGLTLGISGEKPESDRKKNKLLKPKSYTVVDSNVMFVGNSYVGMWRWALGYIGRRRHERFKIYQRGGCGLYPKKLLKRLPRKCRKANKYIWKKVLPFVNSSTFIGLSSSWFYVREKKVARLFKDLVDEISKLGLRPFIMSNAPGLAKNAQPFFACADLSWTPLATLLYGESKWTKRCVPGLIDRGFQTYGDHLDQHFRMKALAELHNVPYVDLFAHLCCDIPAHAIKEEVICRMPANFTYGFYNIGYGRDRHHLSMFGSFSLSSFLESSLVSFGALSPTPSPRAAEER